jgi:hypothetical protein
VRVHHSFIRSVQIACDSADTQGVNPAVLVMSAATVQTLHLPQSQAARSLLTPVDLIDQRTMPTGHATAVAGGEAFAAQRKQYVTNEEHPKAQLRIAPQNPKTPYQFFK